MASFPKLLILFSLLLSITFLHHISTTSAQIYDWPTTSSSAVSLYQSATDTFDDLIDDVTGSGTDGRRSLYWKRHYYISYGALSANRVPCPPRSGRSYYTHNCFRARGPVRPYSRGCSCIARCRR